MPKRLRIWILNRLLRHLFNAVTEDDILRFDGTRLRTNGQVLTQAEVTDLKSQAQTIQQLAMWKLLTAEVRHRANEMIFLKSKTVDDLIFPKAVLYAVDVMTQKIEQVSKLK